MATVTEVETLLGEKTKAELIQFITDLINREENVIVSRDKSISTLKRLLVEYKQKLKEIEAPKLLQNEEIEKEVNRRVKDKLGEIQIVLQRTKKEAIVDAVKQVLSLPTLKPLIKLFNEYVNDCVYEYMSKID